jgi:DNA-directed RNA polymerase subunit RPC12/RpoP
VRLALEHGAVAALARQVLGALGPEERCGRCRRPVLGLHLLRTRGLDERHGVVCPRCGGVLRSYWRYGEAEGLEALAPISLALGLVVEQPVTLGGATLGFQLLPAEREELTAGDLLTRFAELYLEPYQTPVARQALRLEPGGRAGDRPRPLAAGAGVAACRGLSITLAPDAGMAAEGLLELLRTRIERRFRPGG